MLRKWISIFRDTFLFFRQRVSEAFAPPAAFVPSFDKRVFVVTKADFEDHVYNWDWPEKDPDKVIIRSYLPSKASR